MQRLSPLFAKEDIFIIGSNAHEIELHRQIEQLYPGFPLANILLEPKSCNTAPAILWGLTRIPPERWDDPLVILPADHLIQDRKGFLKHLEEGCQLALKGWILTFGIQPNRPDYLPRLNDSLFH